jgi:hypothetical protein
VLEAGDSASTFQTDGQKELVKVQQQAARRGLKTALAEVRMFSVVIQRFANGSCKLFNRLLT